MTEQKKDAEIVRLKLALEQFEIAKQIGNSNGFYVYYFNIMIPKYDTRKAAFDALNELHFDFFKEKRYSNYDSFRQFVRTFRKKIRQ